jgi:soluble lytic murein transglycosylase-like protein
VTRPAAVIVLVLVLAPRPGEVRASSWFSNPSPPSKFFTDPPRSAFFTNPPPPSKFFTNPPRSAWFDHPPPPSRFFTNPRRSWLAQPLYAAHRGHGTPEAYDALIHDIAARRGVEYALVKAIIHAESDFDRLAVSPKGACGLMQLMPATASEVGVADVFLPAQNIDGGCRYLRYLLDRYAGDVRLAVAAYDAGPQRVDAARGIPPIPETREYLSRVLAYRLDYLARR